MKKARLLLSQVEERARESITEESYPRLWQLQQYDAELHSLPAMPAAPAQLMQLLKETKGESGVPFGRPLAEDKCRQDASIFIRMLICLELDKVRYCQLPTSAMSMSMEQLIHKVMQHRQEHRESSDAHPPCLLDWAKP